LIHLLPHASVLGARPELNRGPDRRTRTPVAPNEDARRTIQSANINATTEPSEGGGLLSSRR
jgi:hypothetical protein